MQVTQDFTMDPNLLVSVIKSQAGTLSKALLEGVMNSIDAGATAVHITLNPDSFVIEDDGRGFKSQDEVKTWFGRFGTPHQAGDATFGKFRMGRGQLMSFAATRWLSNQFCMDVDIEGRGLTYELHTLDERKKGCRVEGKLYQTLASWELSDTRNELKKFVLYAPKPVYVNGTLFGASPSRLKSWSYEDDDAYYKVVQGSESVEVYNQGVFVQTVGAWRFGMGGVIVSKKPLEVNFARNAVLESKCEVWGRIHKAAERHIVAKLSQANKLDDSERKFLARRAMSSTSEYEEILRTAKIVTDPTGRHHTLESLKNYARFMYIPESGPLACALHGSDSTFVVTDALLSRFGSDCMEDFIQSLQNRGGMLRENVSLVTAREAAALGLGSAKQLETSGLTPRLMAGFRTLEWLNSELAIRLRTINLSTRARELKLGFHKRNTFIAWTDGATYISTNKSFIKKLESGLNGAWFWVNTLVHEYTHDTDDSESHAHG